MKEETCVCMCTHMYACMRVCMCVCMCCVYACVQCMQVCILYIVCMCACIHVCMYVCIIIIIINSFYRAQITFKSLSAFRTRIDRHMYKNTQKHEEEIYQTEKHIIKYHSLHNNGNYFTNKWDFNKDLNWSSDEHSLISSGSWFQRWGIEYWKDRWPYDLVTTLCGVNNCLVLDRSNLDGWYSWRSCCK